MKYSEEKADGEIRTITRALSDGPDLILTVTWRGTKKIEARNFRVSKKAIRAWAKELTRGKSKKKEKKDG